MLIIRFAFLIISFNIKYNVTLWFLFNTFYLLWMIIKLNYNAAAFYTYWVFFSTISFSDYLGRIHSSSFFISSNSIFFTMHSLGIIGFPRRIYDYSMIFFKFQWFNSLGLIGIYVSIIILLFIIYYFIIYPLYF